MEPAKKSYEARWHGTRNIEHPLLTKKELRAWYTEISTSHCDHKENQ